MSRASHLARWIIQAEFHLVGIMHPSTIRALDHGRLFLSCCLVWIHDNVRLPNVVREATMLVALNEVLYRDIPASYAGCGRYPYNSACMSLAACPVGDMLALLEVAEWRQGPVQVLKLLVARSSAYVSSSLPFHGWLSGRGCADRGRSRASRWSRRSQEHHPPPACDRRCASSSTALAKADGDSWGRL